MFAVLSLKPIEDFREVDCRDSNTRAGSAPLQDLGDAVRAWFILK